MTSIYIREGTPLPERKENDFYQTPLAVALDALSYIPITPHYILDPGAGLGVWGNAARQLWPHSDITGVEIQSLVKPHSYNKWINNFDYAYMLGKYNPKYHLIIGNPPFKHAAGFIKNSYDLLFDNGYIVFLLPINFLGSKIRKDTLWNTYIPSNVIVSSKRVSFSNDGKTNGDVHAYYIWQKGYTGETKLSWSLY